MRFARRPEVRAALIKSTSPEATLFQRDIFFECLALTWILLLPMLGLPIVAVGFLLSKAGAHPERVGAAVFTFVAAFCLTGGADAWVRLLLVSWGERRYKRPHWTADRRVWLVLRVSGVAEFTFFVQIAVALFLAWRFY